ncbi:hypothetical protein Daesc_000986 [Daldinia eschscholtzii]|uniref:Uncharacterized protein n=1 Tax=Daldinia eschscholtzii TaxID=292717 RepID=A0AAX6N180_9PEZI
MSVTQAEDQAPMYLSEVSVVAPKPIRPMPSFSALAPALEVVEPPLERVSSNPLSVKPERPAVLSRRMSTSRIRRWGKGQRDTTKIAYEDTSMIPQEVLAKA